MPVHREGHIFVAAGAALTLLFWWLWSPLGWLFAIATAAVACFFRDPERVTPIRDGLVIAPADGQIESVAKVRPPADLGFGDVERTRIVISLSLLDVHVNRAPVSGKIARSVYVPGAFLNATNDKSAEDNERRSLIIAMADGQEIAVVQIAGFISRRIVTFVDEGNSVGAGQRFGLIRFGSRVDVYLPPGREALVAAGQRAVAGETVVADFASSEPPRQFRRD